MLSAEPVPLLRRGTTREDKAGVTGSLGERQQFFGGFGGDGDIFNTRDAESPIESLYPCKKPARGMGSIIAPAALCSRAAWAWAGHRRVE